MTKKEKAAERKRKQRSDPNKRLLENIANAEPLTIILKGKFLPIILIVVIFDKISNLHIMTNEHSRYIVQCTTYSTDAF